MDCYSCLYNCGGNERGFCHHPSRCDNEGEPGFSEVTSASERQGLRPVCENYEYERVEVLSPFYPEE
mgnify:CR=1 FL=1